MARRHQFPPKPIDKIIRCIYLLRMIPNGHCTQMIDKIIHVINVSTIYHSLTAQEKASVHWHAVFCAKLSVLVYIEKHTNIKIFQGHYHIFSANIKGWLLNQGCCQKDQNELKANFASHIQCREAKIMKLHDVCRYMIPKDVIYVLSTYICYDPSDYDGDD